MNRIFVKLYIIFSIGFLNIYKVPVMAQEPVFSQFYAAPVFLNPSLTGGITNYQFNLNYRTNLNKNFYPYQIAQITAVIPVKLKSKRQTDKYAGDGYTGGIGLTLFTEKSGSKQELSVNGFSFSMAYFTRISLLSHLSFGLQAGLTAKKLDYSKLMWGSQFDPLTGYNSSVIPLVELPSQKIFYPVINAGLTWYYNLSAVNSFANNTSRFFLGAAITNLNTPQNGFFNTDSVFLPLLFKFHGGAAIQISENIEILPNFLVMQQNKQNYFNIGTYVAYLLNGNKNADILQFQLGIWYRPNDSYITSLGLETTRFIFGLSYDFPVSELKYEKKGIQTTEISVMYKFLTKGKKQDKSISHPII